MDRIAQCFRKSREEKRAAFIAYICAGDPDYSTSLRAAKTLIDCGTDLLELGMPFSDPLADGKTNQYAAERALESGIKQDDVFKLVTELRSYTQAPIIFYTYYNLVLAHGEDEFCRRAAEAGIDGVLTLDLPPEYAGSMIASCKKHGLKNIFIIAPTTPAERMEKICAVADGFIYYVSREGVTGERAALSDTIGSKVAEIRKHTNLPIAVGFGVSTRKHVAEIAKMADGAVVGSALVNCIGHTDGNRDEMIAKLKAKADDLIAGCPVA
ncbi:MAG: tryptophan synthase subunit alpha [Opitutales bacterium]|nr:tryptophan synthase subunit alpha [Opitutales bacterium]